MGSSRRERMRSSEVARGETRKVVRVWMLGGFRVSVDFRTIPQDGWRLRKAATLVKLLALAPGHRMHREQAMDLLWPDSGRKAASNSLRSTLHTARKVLDPPMGSRYLASDDESLVLCPEGDLWVDVDAFEQAAARARGAKESATYRAALDLYEGDLLPEDRYEEWTEGRREELRQIYLALLVELAGLHEARDEHGLAIKALRKATAREPTLEEAQVALMRLYAISGRPERALAQYEWFRDVLSRGLGSQPAEATRRLRDEIAAGILPMTPSVELSREKERPGVGKHNLPAPRNTFVGREQEMVKVKRTLAMSRLLTLTGAGGSGKTRLALEVARDLIGSYPDGVWLVELAPLSEPRLLAQEVAGALHVSERPGESLTDALVDALGEKEMLLVVDNCEHLVEEAARLVDALLASCPYFRVLATSREPLGIGGEAIWQVSPLSLPATTEGELNGGSTAEALMRYEAVRLFVDRARLRLPDFDLTRGNVGAVARVCQRLEGMPLAIELATARMGALAVEQVAQRLDVSLDVLKGTSRTAEPRQQTLRATLDWSYNLLSETEQALFRRFSVFAGGWTLEATEAVCSGGEIEQDDVLDLLGGLVDKSLVVARVATTGGAIRYRILEPVRQYARERLEESGETQEIQRRHAAFFLTLAKEAEPGLTGAQQQAWMDYLEAEHDNLRAALSWSLENESQMAIQLAVALAHFWEIRSQFLEGSRWLEAALQRNGSAEAAARAKALSEAGTFAWHRGQYDQAAALHGEALNLYREQGDDHGVAFALNCLGVQDLEQGDYQRAKPLFRAALASSRELGDQRTIGGALHNLAEVARFSGDYEQAKILGMEALAVYREMEDEWQVARMVGWLGMATFYNSDDHEAAAEFLREGLALNREVGSWEYVAYCLEGFAGLAGAKGEGVRAARLFGAAERLREDIAAPLPPVDRAGYERSIVTARAQLDGAAWEAAWKEGRAMAPEEAVEHALSEQEPDPSTPLVPEDVTPGEATGDLTRREREIALLVARGLTNHQISKELVISERTAGNHIAKILKKLGLRSRAQIASWVSET